MVPGLDAEGGMQMLNVVFWDVDGTLADTEMDGHRPAFNRAFQELGLPFQWNREEYARRLEIPGGLRRVQQAERERERRLKRLAGAPGCDRRSSARIGHSSLESVACARRLSQGLRARAEQEAAAAQARQAEAERQAELKKRNPL